MRIRIRQTTTWAWEPPARDLTQMLRLAPRSFEGQHVVSWRIDVDCDCRLHVGDDAFGNILHRFNVDGPLATLRLDADGIVETFDTAGIVRGTVERLPVDIFLRDTPLTAIDAAIRNEAVRIGGAWLNPLDRLHALMMSLHESIDGAETGDGPAIDDATALKLVHRFVGMARALNAPARIVSGLLFDPADMEGAGRHVWAEAHAPGLGWVGFDPVHGHCPGENYVRIGSGLDYPDVTPVRSALASGLQKSEQTDLQIALV